MVQRFKRIGTILLVGLILACLVAGAYAASANKVQDGKVKNSKQAVGKNWGDRPGVIKPNGTPTPKKNLFKKSDSSNENAIQQDLEVTSDVPVSPDEEME